MYEELGEEELIAFQSGTFFKRSPRNSLINEEMASRSGMQILISCTPPKDKVIRKKKNNGENERPNYIPKASLKRGVDDTIPEPEGVENSDGFRRSKRLQTKTQIHYFN